MIYPIKTLSQLPLVLKGFRKSKGLTQATMAEKLGITQQSYAYFEAHPATATLERMFMVLRLLDVEISLNQTAVASNTATPSRTKVVTKPTPSSKTSGTGASKKATSQASIKALAKTKHLAAPSGKKESW